MAKKKLTIEEVLVPKDEIPYEVPENWCWVRLAGLIDEVKNGTTIKQNKDGIGPKVTRIESVQNNEIDFNRVGYIAEIDKIKDNDWYQDGDIALSHINSIEHVGKTSLIKSEYLPLVHGMNLLRIRLKKELINPRYFALYTQGYDFKLQVVNRVNRAVNQVSLNQKNLNDIPISLPPLSEQERIVNRIESLFENVDKASELVEEAREGFENRRTAILEKAFSGELTKSWRKENNIENEWKTEKLSNYIKLISGQHIMSKDYNEDFIGVPYLTGPSDFNEIYPVVSKWTESPKVMATTDDILITVKGSGVGKVNICSIDEVAISRQLMAIRCLKINNIYLFWYLKNKFNSLQQLSTGTAIPGLSRGDILDLNINIPSEDEQQKVVDILQDMLSKESQIDNTTEIFDNIEVIKKSILAKAFRGELGSNNLEEESSINSLEYLLEK